MTNSFNSSRYHPGQNWTRNKSTHHLGVDYLLDSFVQLDALNKNYSHERCIKPKVFICTVLSQVRFVSFHPFRLNTPCSFAPLQSSLLLSLASPLPHPVGFPGVTTEATATLAISSVAKPSSRWVISGLPSLNLLT